MIESNIPHPLPNETQQYRDARNELLQMEIELRALTHKAAKARQALPTGGAVPHDYEFMTPSGPVRMSQLFGEHGSLILYSLMYGPDDEAPCPMCTAFLDNLNGAAPLISQRCALAVVLLGPIGNGVKLANSRGWSNLRLVSSAANSYNNDYFGQAPDGMQLPMCNVFSKSQKGIHHFWASEMLFAGLDGQPRHIDTIWPLWNALDLLPEGRGTDWYPKLGL